MKYCLSSNNYLIIWDFQRSLSGRSPFWYFSVIDKSNFLKSIEQTTPLWHHCGDFNLHCCSASLATLAPILWRFWLALVGSQLCWSCVSSCLSLSSLAGLDRKIILNLTLGALSILDTTIFCNSCSSHELHSYHSKTETFWSSFLLSYICPFSPGCICWWHSGRVSLSSCLSWLSHPPGHTGSVSSLAGSEPGPGSGNSDQWYSVRLTIPILCVHTTHV